MFDTMKARLLKWVYPDIEQFPMMMKSYLEAVSKYDSNQVQTPVMNFRTAADEGYKRSIWVYRCVNEIAKRMTSVKWGLYTLNNAGEKEEVLSAHPMKALLEKPNRNNTWTQFVRMHCIFKQVSGNDYLDISERVGMGKKSKIPTAMYHLRPDRIWIQPNEDGTVKYFLRYGSTDKEIPFEDVVHCSYFDPSDDYYGLSPLYVGGNLVDATNSANQFNKYMFQNQARPSGFLQTEDKLGDTAFKRLQEMIQGMMGTKNNGKPVILEAGLKWVQQQLSQKDCDYLGFLRMSREDICGLYGVPPIIVGILDRATYSNYREANPILWEQTVLPACDEFRDDINKGITSLFEDGTFVDYDASAISALKENEDAVHTRAREDYKAGLITRNEARQETGRDPDPDPEQGDAYFSPAPAVSAFPGRQPQEDASTPEEDLALLEAGKKKAYIQVIEYKAKIINASPSEVTQYLSVVEKRKERTIDRGKRLLTPILSAAYQQAEKQIRASDRPKPEQIASSIMKEHKEALKGFYKDFYSNSILYFGNHTLADLKASVKGLSLPREYKDDQLSQLSELSDNALQWIAEMTGEQVTKVADTTKQQIKHAIADGLLTGATTAEIAESILEMQEISTMFRAELIAVTESHILCNAGNYYGMESTGLGDYLKKLWHTAADQHVRKSHNAMQGQKKKFSEPFTTGRGYKMLFPGDSSMGAPGSEIIRCRCAQTYDTTDIGGLVDELSHVMS